jgi:hypothetical protein
MARPALEGLLARLDPTALPVYVLLPAGTAATVAAPWALPR